MFNWEKRIYKPERGSYWKLRIFCVPHNTVLFLESGKRSWGKEKTAYKMYKNCPHPLYFENCSKLWKTTKHMFDYFGELFFLRGLRGRVAPRNQTCISQFFVILNLFRSIGDRDKLYRHSVYLAQYISVPFSTTYFKISF